MTEIVALNARTSTPDGSQYAATFAVHDDGTVTRQITAVNGAAVDNRPATFRYLDERERRMNCADRISAIWFLRSVIGAEGWTVA
jgi:hypothetical protein